MRRPRHREMRAFFSCLAWRAIPRGGLSSTEDITLGHVQRGTAIVLRTAIDMGQWQGPRGTAQLLGTALGDARGAAEQLQVLLLQGLLQVCLLTLWDV